MHTWLGVLHTQLSASCRVSFSEEEGQGIVVVWFCEQSGVGVESVCTEPVHCAGRYGRQSRCVMPAVVVVPHILVLSCAMIRQEFDYPLLNLMS